MVNVTSVDGAISKVLGKTISGNNSKEMTKKTFTYSKSTKETLEIDVNHVQS